MISVENREQLLEGLFPMTIDELIPWLGSLSQGEKLRLVQTVLQQLEQEASVPAQPRPLVADCFDPRRFYGVAHQSQQAVDQYLAASREGWDA